MRYSSPMAQAIGDSMTNITGMFLNQPTQAEIDSVAAKNEYYRSQARAADSDAEKNRWGMGAEGRMADAMKGILTTAEGPRAAPTDVGPQMPVSQVDYSQLPNVLPALIGAGGNPEQAMAAVMQALMQSNLKDPDLLARQSLTGANMGQTLYGTDQADATKRDGDRLVYDASIYGHNADLTGAKYTSDNNLRGVQYTSDNNLRGTNRKTDMEYQTNAEKPIVLSPGQIAQGLSADQRLVGGRAYGAPTVETVQGAEAQNFANAGGFLDPNEVHTPGSFAAHVTGGQTTTQSLDQARAIEFNNIAGAGGYVDPNEVMPPDTPAGALVGTSSGGSAAKPEYVQVPDPKSPTGYSWAVQAAGVPAVPETTGTGPGEAKRYVDTKTGQLFVSRDGGLTDADGNKMPPSIVEFKSSTGDQSKDAQLAVRLDQDLAVMNSAPPGFDPTEMSMRVFQQYGNVPLTGIQLAQKFRDPYEQQYMNAVISAAMIMARKDTGAAYSAQEWADFLAQVAPMYGEGPEVQADKKNKLIALSAGLRANAGNLYLVTKRDAEASMRDKPPTGGDVPPPPVGTIEDGHRFKGGDAADPANWEPVQ